MLKKGVVPEPMYVVAAAILVVAFFWIFLSYSQPQAANRLLAFGGAQGYSIYQYPSSAVSVELTWKKLGCSDMAAYQRSINSDPVLNPSGSNQRPWILNDVFSECGDTCFRGTGICDAVFRTVSESLSFYQKYRTLLEDKSKFDYEFVGPVASSSQGAIDAARALSFSTVDSQVLYSDVHGGYYVSWKNVVPSVSVPVTMVTTTTLAPVATVAISPTTTLPRAPCGYLNEPACDVFTPASISSSLCNVLQTATPAGCEPNWLLIGGIIAAFVVLIGLVLLRK